MKKSKFQERLDTITKNYNPEDDGGSINDKLKLHRMGLDMDGDQTQDQDYVKRYSIKDMDTIILSIEDKVIPTNEMPENNYEAHQGYNTAIRECITLLKRINRETKAKDLK